MSTISPLVRVFAWEVGEMASPVGNRTTPGGAFAFKYMVASGCSTADPMNPGTTSGTLIFESAKFDFTNGTPPYLESKPACITFNMGNSGVAISELKLFLIDDSALKPGLWNGAGRAFIQYAPSGSLWKYNLSLPSGSVQRLTTSIPAKSNVKRQDGGNALIDQNDQNSSEFVYMNLIAPLGFPFGEYGVCGSGLLRFGLIFDFWPNDFLLSF